MKLMAYNRRTRRWLGRVALGMALLAVAVPTAPALGGIPPEPAGPVAVELTADLPNGLTADDVRQQNAATSGQPTPVTGDESGFDWGDAAVGLGIGVAGSVLLALGATGFQRRRGTLADA